MELGFSTFLEFRFMVKANSIDRICNDDTKGFWISFKNELLNELGTSKFRKNAEPKMLVN